MGEHDRAHNHEHATETASYIVCSGRMGDQEVEVGPFPWGGVHFVLEEQQGTQSWTVQETRRPDMTDAVLSNPELVHEVLKADRELREGRVRLLSLEEVFGE